MRFQTPWLLFVCGFQLSGLALSLSQAEISTAAVSEGRQLSTLLDDNATETTDPANVCDMLIFVPFSYNRTSGNYFSYEFLVDKFNNLGFSHLAAAALAVRHFNARDASVVPELADPRYKYTLSSEEADNSPSCPIQLSIGGAYDTGTITHRATESLFLESSTVGGLPCAMVGTYNDLPAQTMGAAAVGAKIPLTIQRAYNMRSTDSFYTPYTTTLYPDQGSLASVLTNYLRYQGRDNYIALLYKLGDTPIQLQQVVSIALDLEGWEHRSYSYYLPGDPAGMIEDDHGRLPTTNQTLEQIQQEGFRTIVCIVEFPELELPVLAQAAAHAGVNTRDYFWVFLGIDMSVFSLPPVDVDFLTLGLLAGGAVLTPLERFDAQPDDDAFLESWNSVSSQEFIDTLNSLPKAFQGQNNQTFPGYYQATPDYFQQFRPASGAGFMYDSIIATGLGACHAYQMSRSATTNYTTVPDNTLFSNRPLWHGPLHLNGIRQTNFEGATGGVSFQPKSATTPGRRNVTTATFGVLNMFDRFASVSEDEWFHMMDAVSGMDELFSISHILDTMENPERPLGEKDWIELHPFVFRNGQTTPPVLLRDEPDQNHLSRPSQIMGLSLMAIVMVGCIASAIWLYLNREERIVKAAQPPFMYRICVGAFIQAFGIFPLSFDEGSGATQSQLDMACVAIPWAVSVGHMVVYGSLFGKLWRVNRVLQFRRTTLSVMKVAWPGMALCCLAVCFMAIMTAVDPLQWHRRIVDEATGESIGQCECGNFAVFSGVLAILMIIPTAAAGVMAYKTIDVDSEFAESYWIFVLIVLQVEVTILGIPMITILRDLDTHGRYWGILMVIWTFPASTISLLMIPKVLAHRRVKVYGSVTRVTRGGGKGRTHVSGINMAGEQVQPRTSSQNGSRTSNNTGKRQLSEEEASRRLSELSNIGVGARSEMSQDTDI